MEWISYFTNHKMISFVTDCCSFHCKGHILLLPVLGLLLKLYHLYNSAMSSHDALSAVRSTFKQRQLWSDWHSGLMDTSQQLFTWRGFKARSCSSGTIIPRGKGLCVHPIFLLWRRPLTEGRWKQSSQPQLLCNSGVQHHIDFARRFFHVHRRRDFQDREFYEMGSILAPPLTVLIVLRNYTCTNMAENENRVLDILPVSTWVSSRFSEFLLPFINILLVAINCP